MKTLHKLQLKNILKKITWIRLYDEDWDYDSNGHYIKLNKTLDFDNVYIDVDMEFQYKDPDIKINSLYIGEYEYKLTDKQHDTIAQEIINYLYV